MGVDPIAAEFAEAKWGEGREAAGASTDVVSRAEYERVRDTAIRDHEVMQSRIDNQKAIIDRLADENARLKERLVLHPEGCF